MLHYVLQNMLVLAQYVFMINSPFLCYCSGCFECVKANFRPPPFFRNMCAIYTFIRGRKREGGKSRRTNYCDLKNSFLPRSSFFVVNYSFLAAVRQQQLALCGIQLKSAEKDQYFISFLLRQTYMHECTIYVLFGSLHKCVQGPYTGGKLNLKVKNISLRQSKK